MENIFDKIINQTETVEAPTSLDESLKLERWKKDRVARITSSQMPKFMTSGRGKGEIFGKQAIGILLQTKGEARTGETFDKDLDIFNFRWGRENEPKAFNKLKVKNPKIVCSDDFDDIIFNKYGKRFGDSPDFQGVVTIDGQEIECTGEIKCPVDRVKIEIERDPIEFISEAANGKRSYHEYFWQMIGHLLANDKAQVCVYVVYDAYTGEIYPHYLWRRDVETEIGLAKERIDFAEVAIEACEKDNWSNKPITNINNEN